ncbi:hypothetical protein [Methylobacterium mesophilicum]|uniref:hypothetical protein n=1 Tax=Methylobacterium mesophilicum TaxID=39956 RepID=UPI001EE19E75|nr:hypothetical protein [Methylobacterium mesophilicum]
MIESIVVSCLSEGCVFEARPDGGRRDALAVGGLAGRSDQPGEQMRRPALVVDDGAASPGVETEPPLAQRLPEALAVGRGVPCAEGGRPYGGERHARPFLDQALSRGEGRNWSLGIQRAGGLQPVCHVLAALLAQGLCDAPAVFGGNRREAEFVFDDSADFLAPGIVPGDVDDAPVPADEAVDPMLVAASVLDMLGPAIGLPGQLELAFEEGPPTPARSGVVRDLGLRVDVHMIAGRVRPAA